MTFSVHSQNELQAAGIAQECIDQLRSQQFSFISQYPGNHSPILVGTSPSGDAVFPRPLLRDTSLTYYNSAAVSDTNNYLKGFTNTVAVTMTNLTINTMAVTVSVTWIDGRGPHTYTSQTTLASDGLNG
jgi:hypothetical protein